MEKPIFDPSIPYIGPIYGSKFTPGKMVRIQGISPGVAYRFNIHLQCGPDIAPRDDVAIQVSVRLLEGYIILNSLQNGIWDEEQRGAAMPIKRAEKFEIILMCDFSQYKVAINGQHYCEFPQRVHYDRITHLAIDGDVSIMQISYESPVGDAMGSTSGSAVISGISAPISLSHNEKETEFEMIDSPGKAASPPYGAAVHGAPYSSGVPYPTTRAAYPTSAAPYPTTGAAYPTSAAPYPTTGSAYPTSGAPYLTSGAPYPTTEAPYLISGAPYPTTGAVYPSSAAPYPSAGAPYPSAGAPYPQGAFYSPAATGMPPPPPGPPVPLNFSQPVQRSNLRKFWLVFCGGLFSILLITLIIFKIINGF